jgi:hypothetical protein
MNYIVVNVLVILILIKSNLLCNTDFEVPLSYIISNKFNQNYNYNSLCGINSIYIVNKLFDKNTAYSKILNSYRNIPRRGLNVSQLEAGLLVSGLYYLSLKFPKEKLVAIPNSLMIVHSHSGNSAFGHYYVLRVLSDERIQIIDPPHIPKIIKLDEISDEEILTATLVDISKERIINTAEFLGVQRFNYSIPGFLLLVAGIAGLLTIVVKKRKSKSLVSS